MVGCNCDAGLSNTGRPNCVPLFSVTSSLIMVPLKDNTGTRNGINVNTPITANQFVLLTQQSDPSKRWFPSPKFENVDLPIADSQFEEAPSGRMVKLRDGKRSFTGEIWGEDASNVLAGKMRAGACVEFGVYLVDVNGNLIGSKEGNFLYPIPVDSSSWDVKFMFATDSASQKIMVGFDVYRLFNDATLYMITSEEGLQDFNALEGLIDATIVISSISTTGFVATITQDFGTAVTAGKVKGLLAADVLLYNNTDSAAVVPTSFIETTDGVYTAVMVAQTSADSLTLSTLTTSGYDGTVDFLIP